ncbi:MAG: Rrf2 family transcriptional regulator [Treponema sp.]|jgi:Rrf2 family protein|nr:Rrf2 family transcriptional regulator [Treponema sp.]
MKISTKGRYSLEALLYISLQPDGNYISTRSIAENTGISEGYLEQLFIPLRKMGIVRGTRGPLGGYVIADSPAKISVGDILRAVEGPLVPVDCAVTDHLCAREKSCETRHTWKELYQEIAECVDSLSLKDLSESYRNFDSPDYTI